MIQRVKELHPERQVFVFGDPEPFCRCQIKVGGSWAGHYIVARVAITITGRWRNGKRRRVEPLLERTVSGYEFTPATTLAYAGSIIGSGRSAHGKRKSALHHQNTVDFPSTDDMPVEQVIAARRS